MTRHLDFDGIHNFRDFGGYATASGRRLKGGRLYRSANHARASDADLERLRALGLAVIVDLRQPDERRREPSRRWDGFACHVVDNDQSEDHLSFEQLVLEASDLSAAWFRDHCLGFYARAPYEPRHVDLYRRYFRALADSDGAVLVHCAAGKDRTGLICALTHHVAGVHRDDILHDYLLTNDEERMAAKIASIGPFLQRLTGKRPTDEALRIAVGVDADYLDRAFEVIAARDGSLDGYLEKTLGLDAGLREQVQERLVA
ncbi:MAG TPA: tyrosine-protein phosphatase [Phenylobacterium sp.]|uniref:tyrosine-protein phosphatase n=1 Tax=Phenylobacterium sp. TaxID=1871053 RepID=UPI002B4938BB|nr:tyrosine-protein phosphatase [Phenylobacterium sp.]HKR87693.1 tyrosine-protein phosphatase [Phenylobacterium sp.]